MLATIPNIEIKAIAGAVPKDYQTILERGNGQLTDKKAKRLSKAIGFEQFTTTKDGMSAGDLCFEAATLLLEKTGFDKKEIDAVIFLSQMPDYISPPTSNLLQAKLGIGHEAICLDINNGCPGYVYGLYISSVLINSGTCKNVLLCVGDTKSKVLYPSDLSTTTIFGDGGTATLVSQGTTNTFFNIQSYGEMAEVIMTKRGAGKKPHVSLNDPGITEEDYRENFLKMDGTAVMDFTLRMVPETIKNFLNYTEVDKNTVDLFAIHQANKIIVDSIAENLGVNLDKVPFVAKNTGNTSSASIPLMLSQITNKTGEMIVLASGFGVGLSIANSLFSLNNTKLCGIKVV